MITRRWEEEIVTWAPGQNIEVTRIIGEFVVQLASFLPWLLGPHTDQLLPLRIRTSELFGAMSAKRGLAAGEVIEEFQILKELLIRDLCRDLPLGGYQPRSLREILQLNALVGRGITRASVGHTDAMFSQLFEAREVSAGLSPDEVAREADAQLELIREETAAILGSTPAGRVDTSTKH